MPIRKIRRPLFVSVLLMAACSPAGNDGAVDPGETPRPELANDTPLPPLPAPEATPRYVGRWAANETLCASGVWNFGEHHLATAGEVSCDYAKVTQVPGGYDLEAACLAEGTQTQEVIELRFAESASAMQVESKTFRPVGLIRCD